jgi:hypothetical protein
MRTEFAAICRAVERGPAIDAWMKARALLGLVLTDRASGKGGVVEGVVFWGWRNVRSDPLVGAFSFWGAFAPHT